MVKIFEGTEHEYYIDGYLKSNIEIAKNVISKDWDMVFVVDGTEGGGKSVLAQQLAFFCDPTLTNERIVFTPNSFRKAIMQADKFQAVIYDEAYTGLSSRATMSHINKVLVSMLAEIRQKNLFVFIVMPTFFDLDKYVALWRSRALIHIYTSEGFERGYFAFYNADKKKDLYINGKKFYNYSNPRPNFTGRFTNHYCVDEEIYKKNKRNSLMAQEDKLYTEEQEKEVENKLFERVISFEEGLSHNQKARLLDMPESTYFQKLRRFKNEQND